MECVKQIRDQEGMAYAGDPIYDSVVASLRSYGDARYKEGQRNALAWVMSLDGYSVLAFKDAVRAQLESLISHKE